MECFRAAEPERTRAECRKHATYGKDENTALLLSAFPKPSLDRSRHAHAGRGQRLREVGRHEKRGKASRSAVLECIETMTEEAASR